MIKLLYCACLFGLSMLTASSSQTTEAPSASYSPSTAATATDKKITTTVLNTTTMNVVPFFFFPKNSSHENDTSFTFLIDAGTTISDSSPRGFIVDLLRVMSKKTVNNNESFAFNVHVVKDNKYGSRINASCCFDGMLGELGRGEAQLAAAPLTVTMDRETYVDFTSPILKWEALAVHRRRLTSIFRQAPANVDELLASDSTKWAVLKDGPLHQHLFQSRDEHDIRFRDRITHFLNTNDEGIEWVTSSFDHVFLLEEVAAKWAVTRQCNSDGPMLVAFRTGIFERHYSFALPHLSHNRDKLNLILHDLYDQGTLADLHKTWWLTSRCSRASLSASVFSPLVFSALALTALLAWR